MVVGGGWHCNYSYKLQGPGEILRVDLELNLTVDLKRVRPGPELVNFKCPLLSLSEDSEYLQV